MRRLGRWAAVVSIALLVAGGSASISSASVTTPASPPALGVGSIPWGDVGPGWLLAVWTPNPPRGPGGGTRGYRLHPPQILFLVSPTGVRYQVVREPNNDQLVLGWSGDGRRALQGTSSLGSISQINLATGTAFDRFKVHNTSSNFVTNVAYSSPRGLAIMITFERGESVVLQRYSLTGHLQLTYPDLFGGLGAWNGHFAESPDGTEIAMGTPNGVALVSNDGQLLATYRVPRSNFCSPTRWWTPTIILASCGSAVYRLYEIHVDTGAVNDLTASPKAPDYADENAWATHPGVYVQDAGACGYQYMGKLGPNHRTTPVNVPHAVGSVFILGEANHLLALYTTVACGSGSSVLWYNPFLGSASVVLGPPVTGGGVTGAWSYPGT